MIVAFCAVLGFVQEYRVERALEFGQDALSTIIMGSNAIIRWKMTAKIKKRHPLPDAI